MAGSDNELIIACQNGDHRAFNELVRRYQHAVYGFCYHWTGDFTEAQDLTQETFVRAFLHLTQLRQGDRFPTWLRQIATTLCQRWWQRRTAWPQISLDQPDVRDRADEQAVSPEETAITNEIRSLVAKAIADLPEDQRLAITLYYINGLSYEEIADFLDVPQTTLKMRLHRARHRLKKELLFMVEHEFERHPLPEAFPEQVLQEAELADVLIPPGPLEPRMHVSVKAGTVYNAPLLLLNLKEHPQFRLPITIGQFEAVSIALGRQGEKPPRPQTHDLLITLLHEANATLKQVIVSDLQASTYFAKLVVDFNGTVKEIDCRPSDAIAIAVRSHIPIFVAKRLTDLHTVKDSITAWETAPPPIFQYTWTFELGHLRTMVSRQWEVTTTQPIDEERVHTGFLQWVDSTAVALTVGDQVRIIPLDQLERVALIHNEGSKLITPAEFVWRVFRGQWEVITLQPDESESWQAGTFKRLDPASIALESGNQTVSMPLEQVEHVTVYTITSTPRLQRVLAYAAEEAHRLQDASVGTKHLLLGLIREQDGNAVTILRHLGVEVEAIRQALEETQEARAPAGPILWTAHTKRQLDRAVREAGEMKAPHVDTEHLLLALIQDAQGVAGRILTTVGVNYDTIKKTLSQS